LLINDGQHRRAAIEHALVTQPSLGDETIAVVFYLDQGLKRCQQMFADLNRHAIRPATSLSVLYDHRDIRSEIVRRVTLGTAIFSGLIERERSTLSPRSSKLFTLSSVHHATRELLRDLPGTAESLSDIAIRFWDAVGQRIRDWQQVQAGTVHASTIRAEKLHSHAVVLQALGRVGRVMIATDAQQWDKRLDRLIGIDWSRRNIQWEGRTLIGGRVSKADANVSLTVNLIKNRLGLPLTKDEDQAERAFLATRMERAHG
jgi:DNA sulfur modification protein DndB